MSDPSDPIERLRKELGCRHPFDDVTYVGDGRWECGRCGSLVDRAKKRRDIIDEWICPRCLSVFPEPMDPCPRCLTPGAAGGSSAGPA